jgi:hypothetical protein
MTLTDLQVQQLERHQSWMRDAAAQLADADTNLRAGLDDLVAQFNGRVRVYNAAARAAADFVREVEGQVEQALLQVTREVPSATLAGLNEMQSEWGYAVPEQLDQLELPERWPPVELLEEAQREAKLVAALETDSAEYE